MQVGRNCDLETTGSAMSQFRIVCAETMRILERRGNFLCPLVSPPPPEPTLLWTLLSSSVASAFEFDSFPILGPPNVKNWLLRKDPDAGKDWRQEKKGMTEDETVGWHHRLDGHEFEQALGIGDGTRESGLLETMDHRVRLNWATELNWLICIIDSLCCIVEQLYSN